MNEKPIELVIQVNANRVWVKAVGQSPYPLTFLLAPCLFHTLTRRLSPLFLTNRIDLIIQNIASHFGLRILVTLSCGKWNTRWSFAGNKVAGVRYN